MLTENIGEILKLIFVAAILDVQTGHIRVSEMICAKFDVDPEVCFPGVTGRHGGGVYTCFGVCFF